MQTIENQMQNLQINQLNQIPKSQYTTNQQQANTNLEKNNRQVLADKQQNVNILQDGTAPLDKAKMLLNEQNQKQPAMQLLQQSFQLDEENILEYIEILVDHQKTCEREQKYVEAEMAKKRVQELRVDYTKRLKEELKQRHAQQKMKIEEAHLNEFTMFNEFWDQKMEEFNSQASQLEQDVIAKHQEQMNQVIKDYQENLPQRQKCSAEILNLKKIQESLAKQENYVEAHQVQQQCLQLEKDDFLKYKAMCEAKIANVKVSLEKQQNNELNALRKRIQQGQEEQRKTRSQELERLLQKYQNVKKELEIQQQNENMRLEKAAKNVGSVYSRQSMSRSSRSVMNTSFRPGNGANKQSQKN